MRRECLCLPVALHHGGGGGMCGGGGGAEVLLTLVQGSEQGQGKSGALCAAAGSLPGKFTYGVFNVRPKIDHVQP